MKRQEVLKAIGKRNWEKFLEYMKGQTMGINPDGSADYYNQDVKRFLLLKDLPTKKRAKLEQLIWD